MSGTHTTAREGSPLRPTAGAAAASGGRFVLRERLGAGAFNVTYRARDMRAGHEVALRVVTPPADRLDDTLTQLRAGADAVTALRHAGIVPPATVQRDGEVLLWATPFLDGGSVGELLDMPEPLPFDAVAALVSDAAAALAAAHARGVVHGGLKPTNIFADADGRARITDFGVHDVERALARGHAGIAHALGPYAAPEQWRGAIADARTDQYALAAIAYELITGRRREASVVEGIATLEPLEVQTLGPLRPGLDMRVNEVLRTALSASPVNRFASTTEFVQALAAASRPRGHVSRGGRWPRLRPRHLAAVGIVGLAAAVVALALDPDVRRAVNNGWRSAGKDVTESAAALEIRTPRVGVGALGGATLRVGATSPSTAPNRQTSGGAPAVTRPTFAAPSPPRAPGTGGTTTPPGAAGTSPSGRGTSSEAVASPSGGTTGGAGEGTGRGAAVTVGTRTQRAVDGSRSVVGGLLDRIAPRGATRGTSNGAGAPTTAVDEAPHGGERAEVVSARPAAAPTPAGAATDGFVSITATNALPVVLVDGVPRGTAPTVVRVRRGAHRIEVRAAGMRFRPPTITVGVSSGDTAAVAFWRIP